MTLIDPSRVVSLLDRGPAAAVRVAPERCLNRRMKDSKCALCLDCPSEALTAAGSTVQANAAACSGCGLCFSVCPTEAFTVQGPKLADLLRVGAEWRGDALEVVCRKRPVPNKVTTESAAALRLPCLAWLSQPLAVALVAAGVTKLYLDDTYCASCEIGRVREQIMEAVGRAEALLGSLGRPGSVVLLTGSGTARPTTRTVPVLDPVKPEYSRRDLFGAFRRGFAQAAGAIADERLPSAAAAKRLAPLNPGQSALLAAAMANVATQVGPAAERAAVPISSVVVSEACTACGLCVKLCPTGALEMHQNDTAFQLDVTVSKCLGERCRLCSLICPVKAVTVSSSSTLSEAGGGVVRVLRAGALRPCTKCGVPTAVMGDEALCHACQWTKRAAGGLGSGE